MVAISRSAAEVLSTVREEKGVPDHFGLRVYSEESPQGVLVQLAFTEAPAQGDAVVESEGTQLFVAPELTEPLAEAVIDADETPDGAGLVFRGLE